MCIYTFVCMNTLIHVSSNNPQLTKMGILHADHINAARLQMCSTFCVSYMSCVCSCVVFGGHIQLWDITPPSLPPTHSPGQHPMTECGLAANKGGRPPTSASLGFVLRGTFRLGQAFLSHHKAHAENSLMLVVLFCVWVFFFFCIDIKCFFL